MNRMDTRLKSYNRYSVGVERPFTKKERESLGATTTCPPLITRKHTNRLGYFRRGNEHATPLNFLKKAKLSSLYDEKQELPYIHQVFNLVGKIGEGSFGIVYKGILKEDKNTYAIKMAKKPYKEMVNEVKKLEKVGDHPNCVKYFAAWMETGHVFIQLEYCCSSLAKYSLYNHKIIESELWEILLDMLHALKHLHDKGFIHLDIKPDNILISTEGTYKLGDFGLLVDLLEVKESSKARAEKISEGDAKYLAREVLDKQYTPAADIFSLGITVLELAADLVLPTNGPLWHSLRSGDIPHSYLRIVPRSLQIHICRMMVPNFEVRPTAEQILNWKEMRRRLTKRNSKPRFNYFKDWVSKRKDGEARPDIAEPIEPLKPIIVNIMNRNINNNIPARKLTKQFDLETPKGCPASTSRQLNFDVDDFEVEDILNCNTTMESLMELEPPVSDENNEISADEPGIGDQVPTSTPCRTPPNRISKVILYSL